MERLVRIAKKLRTEENFHGYIHLKTIPGASEELLTEAGMYADRMSINLEMPTELGLKLVAPDKSHDDVKKPLNFVNHKMKELNADRQLIRSTPKFVPAGQSTQMVIGATPENDMEIMHTANQFYKDYNLKRVYYSGYIPINHNDTLLPSIGTQAPLLRENRLYQTDWLMRFYHFDVHELLNVANPHLDTDIDPKLSWALRNLHLFPVDINTADYQQILRIPGIGVTSAKKIVAARKFGKIRTYQLKRLGIAYNRARYFMRCEDDAFQRFELLPTQIKNKILSNSQSKYLKTDPQQLILFPS